MKPFICWAPLLPLHRGGGVLIAPVFSPVQDQPLQSPATIPWLIHAIAGAAALLALLAFARASWAELHFPQTAVHAGDVRTGPVLAQRYRFSHRGKQPIEILDARASCGCLTPRLAKRSYRPGDEGELVLEINTLIQPAGERTWKLQVVYREGETEASATLQLSARLIAEVTVEPGAMTIFTDQKAGHELVLTDRREKPLRIKEVRGSSPKLKAQIVEQTKESTAPHLRKLRVEVSGDCPEGRHEEILGIYTDDPGYADLKVPITIVKRPRQRVTAAPAQVTLLVADGQPIPSKIVLLRDRDDKEVAVASVTADDPAISCTWARGPDALATLKIHIDRAGIRDGRLQSAIHVRLQQPEAVTLTIPVSCTAK